MSEWAGVERAGATKREQSEIARIVAAFDGDAAESRLHAGVSDTKDAFGEMFSCCEGFVVNRGERLCCTRGVELHCAAEEVIGMKAAESQIRVGDGRTISAAVAGGTGISSS